MRAKQCANIIRMEQLITVEKCHGHVGQTYIGPRRPQPMAFWSVFLSQNKENLKIPSETRLDICMYVC